MAKPDNASQTSRDILRALLDPLATEAVPWSSSDLREIIEHQMATHLVSEVEVLATAGRMSRDQVLAIVETSGCQTFRDLFSSRAPDAATLRLVKGAAKASLTHDGNLPRDVARVLYVLAILYGRTASSPDLSSLDDATIERERRRCLTFGWLPEDIRALLRAVG